MTKHFPFILLVISAVFLFSCTHHNESAPITYSALETADLIYSTPNNELVSMEMTNDAEIITTHYTGQNTARWTYSQADQTLFENISIWSDSASYYNDRTHGRISRNNDGCGGGALVGEIEAFLFVADDGWLQGRGGSTGSLVLVAYSPKLAHQHIRLYEFPINSSALSQPETCYVGTNAEHDGIIFFSDAEKGKHALRALELDTKKVTTLFTDDIIMAPAISPTGTQIAYTKYDGIYLYSLSTGNSSQLVELDWIHQRDYDFSHRYHSFFTFMPIASWLPSGDKFSYHVEEISRDPQTGERKVSYDIYSYDLLTGESTLLIENGMNPYWILPRN